ncbi:hypothetical protein [Halorubellus sp. PRR65]|uniref:DUF7511 domain-containing protein n=1 Tax=Halorubellus sp. PRR65 TaxID=3098148 RepID=UPI002B2633AB|nr:hypothetical protein [Halorubellus sp. PRR65]
MSQDNGGSARESASPDDKAQATEGAEAAPLEVLRDPESGRVTFVVRDADDGTKTTEWLTTDADHVVDPSEMQ